MSSHLSDLSNLKVNRNEVPPPRKRWFSRVILPGAILLAALGMLLYSGRDVLKPSVEVKVSPLVIVTGGAATGAGRAGSVVQGPGIVEPRPYAISVPALQDGVISEVLKLEGDQVAVGEIVARMIDADAQIAVSRAAAELDAKRKMTELSEVKKQSALARVREASIELDRMRRMVDAGGATAGELAQIEAKFQSMQLEIQEADAEILVARAEQVGAESMVREAALMLERTVIRSPSSGVVMSRRAEPGMRIMTTIGTEGESDSILRLYDPTNLFVIVDVPLADAAAVHQGLRAEVVTDALPDRVFKGTVFLVVHEANTARNTVQFKIALEEVDPVLKPGMLTRVRIITESRTEQVSDSKELFAAPKSAIVRRGERSSLFVFEPATESTRGTARQIEIEIDSEAGDDFVTFTAEILPGAMVILDPTANITSGSRVRIAEPTSSEGGHEHD